MADICANVDDLVAVLQVSRQEEFITRAIMGVNPQNC